MHPPGGPRTAQADQPKNIENKRGKSAEINGRVTRIYETSDIALRFFDFSRDVPRRLLGYSPENGEAPARIHGSVDVREKVEQNHREGRPI